MKRALTYRQFIKRLYLCEVFIPFFPEIGAAFVIFERGDGYSHCGGGRTFTLIHREDDKIVPLEEIRSALRHLAINQDAFWKAIDHEVPDQPADTPPTSP